MKIYPDGKEEVFCRLNSEETNLIFIELGLLAAAFILFVIGKDHGPKKKLFQETKGPPGP